MTPALLFSAELLRRCASADLLLWEFMPDPVQVDDAAGEWLELYNPGTDSVKLAGWSLATGGGARTPLDSAKAVPPGGFLVVARTDSASNGGAPIGQILSSGWSLPNAAGAIRLFSPGGTQVDSALWGSGSALKSGRSLERIGAACDGGNAACWKSSTRSYGLGDWGTPGAENSQDTTRREVEGGIVSLREGDGFLEAGIHNRGLKDWTSRRVTWDAGAVVGQNLSCRSGDTCAVRLPLSGIAVGDRLRVGLRLEADSRPADDTAGIWLLGDKGRILLSELQASSVAGQPEWLELSQGVGKPFDLSGWSLGDSLQAVPLPLGTVLPVGGHLVLSPDCAGLRAAWRLPSMPCAEVPGWLRLSQVEDRIVLRDDRGATRDSLEWSTAFWGSWPAGKSRERRSRSVATREAANWVASPDALGATPGWGFGMTPGWAEPGAGSFALSIPDRLFCPGDAQVQAVLPLGLVAPPTWNLTVSVFDLDRRRVRRLHHGPAPTSGRLEWDGRDDAGRSCRMGTYLVLVEALTDEGRAVRCREWAVLGRRL